MKSFKLIFIILFVASSLPAQQPLTSELLEKSAIRFSLNAEGQLEDEPRKQWLDWIGDNQYIGLAEVHNSAQLSRFTKAFLNTLNEKGFENFAMEMGPNVAEKLQQIAQDPSKASDSIRIYSRRYSKSRKPLFVFAGKIEDSYFVEEASRLGFNFWGLDQEYLFSFEMHIDKIYVDEKNEAAEFQQAFQKVKALIRKSIFKSKTNGQSTQCWYLSNEDINTFFAMIENEKSLEIIRDIRMSWDIYCKHSQGGSNQLRANYMKQNFTNYLQTHGADAKVFVKLGNVHLTHGISPFGVDDIGKFLTEKSLKDQNGFLIVRHLIAYRNGNSNIGKSGWKAVNMFLELGRKDQWTVVDLRPFREMLRRGEITTNKKFEYELNSYDLLLLSPDDQYPKPNY